MLTLIFESTTSDLVSAYISDEETSRKKDPLPSGQLLQDSLLFEQIPLSELHEKITDIDKYQITIVIPGEQITTKLVTIPKGSKRHIHQALPFLIEDELATSVEDLHFSLSKPNSDGIVLCAVMERALLRDYLQKLGNINIYPSALFPSYWLLPKSDSLQIAEQNHHLIIRLANNTGMVLPSNTPQTLLNHLLGDTNDSELSIKPLTAFHVNQAPLNILQGEFLPVSSEAKNAWLKPTAIAAGICIAIFMSYFLVAGWHFNQQAHKIAMEAEATYKQLVPNETRIIDIRRQMAAHLNQSGSHQTDKLFFKLTGIVAQAIAADTTENTSIRHIRFDQKDATLQLELQSKSMGYAHNLQSQIQKSGVIAEVLSANSNDEGTLTRLKLSENKQ